MPLTKEQREEIITKAQVEERAQPGSGRFKVSEVELLKSLGFDLIDDIAITGVRWIRGVLSIDLKGHAIHWQGGEIVNTNPIRTDTQENDNAEG